MSDLETVTVVLPREIAEDLRRVVATGEFASQDAVVQTALLDWRERREIFDLSTDDLRVLVDEGIASGPGTYSSMDDIKAEARRRWERTEG